MEPFVVGRSPRLRGSMRTASLSAFAKHLNAHSAMWCGSSPYSSFMCRFAPASFANAWKNSRHSDTLKSRTRSEPVHEYRAVAKVNRNPHENFVHREDEEAVAVHSRLVSDGLFHRLPEHNPDVLDGVVVVDVDVALGLQIQVEQPVPREELEHVVEERYARFDGVFALAVEVYFEGDARFFCVARDFRFAFHIHFPFDHFNAAFLKISICAGVPTVILMPSLTDLSDAK